MSEGSIQISYSMNSLISLGMMYYAFARIFEPATSKKWILLAYAVFFVITSYLFFQFESEWLNLVVNITFFLAVARLFSGNLGARVIFALLLYVMNILADAGAFISLQYMHYYQYGRELPMEYILPIGRTLSNIIFLPLLLTVVIIFRTFFMGKVHNRYFKIPILYTIAVFVMLAGIILIDLLFIIAAIGEIQANLTSIIVVQVLVLAIIFFVVWLYNTTLGHLDALEKSRLKDQMLERWEVQYKTVLNAQKVIAELNHNLRYHFLTLAGFLKKGEVERAEAHLANSIGEFDAILNTGNISIDAMLNYYRQRIREALHIDLETELLIPPGMKLDANLMGTALGNALENAMEACEHVEDQRRYIRVKAMLTTAALLVVITNPYVVEPVSDFEGNLVTTKSDDRNHGLGLTSIREMLPEEIGQVYTEYSDGIFRFMLLYYDVLE